jgi:hypothetical protein
MMEMKSVIGFSLAKYSVWKAGKIIFSNTEIYTYSSADIWASP